MRFFIMGGGCYGTFYARQLLRARAARAIAVEHIGIVDSAREPRAIRMLGSMPGVRHYPLSWDDFLDEALRSPVEDARAGGPSAGEDILVTPPFTPHLALAWLLRTLPTRTPAMSWTLEPFARQPNTPFRHQAEGGPLLLSHADWVCPINCIEPDRCPKIRAHRDWDMDRTAHAFAQDLAAAGQPVDTVQLFHCHHVAYGVGGYPIERLPAAAESILWCARGAGAEGIRALVGTISHCHGALHLLSARAAVAERPLTSAGGMEREATNAFLPPLDATTNPDDRVP